MVERGRDFAEPIEKLKALVSVDHLGALVKARREDAARALRYAEQFEGFIAERKESGK